MVLIRSLINGSSNTKIGDDIPVGLGPGGIVANLDTNTIFIANFDNDTVSVINGSSNTKIGDDIPVGRAPRDIGVNPITNTIYVANAGNNTVSIIDGNNNTKIGDDIPVGRYPGAIGVNPITNTIYVANAGNNTVSIIDGKSNELVAGVTFNIQPFNAGRIECPKGNSPAPIAQQFYVYSGAQCTAKPNQGFDFVSWQENLGGNSTRILDFSPPNTWYSTLKDGFLDFLNITRDEPQATLDITKFGSFTANFKTLPPPIPPEFVAALFTVVTTAFVGTWLTPAVIAWRRANNQRGKFNHYSNKLDFYENRKLNNDDIKNLNNLRNEIAKEYTNGKISKEQYDKLVDEISLNYKRFFTDEVHSLNSLAEIDKTKQGLSLLKSNIQDSYDEGKINNEYYVYLNKEISILFKEIFTKKIDLLNNLSENDKTKELNNIEDDLSVAYSKENINELHYTLLKERLEKYEKK
jgi:YVTN family beta-propeller protein